jgi:hypothetical protein
MWCCQPCASAADVLIVSVRLLEYLCCLCGRHKQHGGPVPTSNQMVYMKALPVAHAVARGMLGLLLMNWKGFGRKLLKGNWVVYPDMCVGKIATSLRPEARSATHGVGLRVQPQVLNRAGWSTVCCDPSERVAGPRGAAVASVGGGTWPRLI